MNVKKASREAAATRTPPVRWRKASRRDSQGKYPMVYALTGRAGEVAVGMGLAPAAPTPADVLAQWRAEGVLGAWAGRQDAADSAEYARTLRDRAQRRDWPA